MCKSRAGPVFTSSVDFFFIVGLFGICNNLLKYCSKMLFLLMTERLGTSLICVQGKCLTLLTQVLVLLPEVSKMQVDSSAPSSSSPPSLLLSGNIPALMCLSTHPHTHSVPTYMGPVLAHTAPWRKFFRQPFLSRLHFHLSENHCNILNGFVQMRYFMATCPKVVIINTQIYHDYSMNGTP